MAFGLIGLELRDVWGRRKDREWLMGPGGRWPWVAVVVGAYGWCGCCRPAWLAKKLHRRRDFDEEIPLSWRESVVMWWAGMRGVASVALALAIPWGRIR